MRCQIGPVSFAATNSHPVIRKLRHKLAPIQHQRNSRVVIFSISIVSGHGLNDSRAVLLGKFVGARVSVNTHANSLIVVARCWSQLPNVARVSKHNGIHHPSHSLPRALRSSLVAPLSREITKRNSQSIGSTGS
jgi:hypothetical protein